MPVLIAPDCIHSMTPLLTSSAALSKYYAYLHLPLTYIRRAYWLEDGSASFQYIQIQNAGLAASNTASFWPFLGTNDAKSSLFVSNVYNAGNQVPANHGSVLYSPLKSLRTSFYVDTKCFFSNHQQPTILHSLFHDRQV